jgi:hypothetical protein
VASADSVIDRIHTVFGANEYPGDPWLQGSREGCEPAEEVGPFVGRTRWEALEPAMLDARHAALSFFSEAGFRFFLPAFLVADLRGQLHTAEPLFHLTGGFYDGSVETRVASHVFVRRFGGSTLLNPQRYGASTFEDYTRYRLSVFTREEAAVIVSYLECKREQETIEALRGQIDLALDRFWRDRAATAPTADDLRTHLAEQREYLDALGSQHGNEHA